jgi:hypothetical protein
MSKRLLLHYLDIRRTPLNRLSDGAAQHVDLRAAVPGLYAGLPVDPVADLSHRREALVRLLDDAGAKGVVDRLIDALRSVPALEALRVLEAVRQRGINRQRARRLALSVLLNHPDLPELAATRRVRLARLLRHLVGERTWSAVCRALRPGANGTGARLLRRAFEKYVIPARVDTTREALAVLAGVAVQPIEAVLRRRLAARTDMAAGAGLPRETLFGLHGTFHPGAPASQVRYLAPAAPGRCADGPLTAEYKALWADGEQAVDVVVPVAAGAPLPGRLAVVLDLSASTASSGERAYHPAALGLALVRRLQARLSDVVVCQAGGSAPLAGDGLPRPEGGTELASAVLEAARERPEAILIVTDGYENCRTGDTADVADGLRQLEPALLIVQVVPRFTPAEDLSARRLGDGIPLLPVDHEGDAGELLARVLLAHAGDALTAEELNQLHMLLFTR